jgi:hypothetical protein
MKIMKLIITSTAILASLATATLAADLQPLFFGTEKIPADAIVLFNGDNLDKWTTRDGKTPAGWKVENRYMEVKTGAGGDIQSKEQFGSGQYHIEFWLPNMAPATGQAKANSGVFIQGQYEVQVLDSYGVKTLGWGDCGAIYGMKAPDVNANRPAETWQTFDIVFRAPKLDDKGNEIEKAKITVFLNGVLIHDNYTIPKFSPIALQQKGIAKGPIILQDHHCPIRYRNIWVRPLP